MSALRRWVVLSLGFVLLLSGTAAYDAVTLTRTANVDVATDETPVSPSNYDPSRLPETGAQRRS